LRVKAILLPSGEKTGPCPSEAMSLLPVPSALIVKMRSEGVQVPVMRSEGFLVEGYLGTVRREGRVALSDLVAVNGRGVSEVLPVRDLGVHNPDVVVLLEGYALAVR
jgi:hypothetical protein